MEAALDDVAFLANSTNRVAVLRTLADRPHHRDELQEAVDASRVTLTRNLNDLEAKGWIERRGQVCEVTPLGAWVWDEFTRLLETMTVGSRLRDVLQWFPTERVPFDVRRLRDASVVLPTQTSLAPHVRRAADHLRSARRARVLASQIAPSIVEATATAVEEHGQRFEAVLTPGLVETVTNDPAVGPQLAELHDAAGVDLYVARDEHEGILFVADGTVGFLLTDDEGVARALVLSEDEIVYEWATEAFERRRARAEPIEPLSFTA